ncbi:MAG: glycosyltransferase family 4 protein [Kiritimatiellae bacterium]|nr:glycosyltransferase family 4 protein [Kiritimatiellia bacterium]
MNVWIVNPFDNLPLEGYRPMRFWLMSEAFREAGHNVVYWTSDFSHVNKKKRVLDSDVEAPFDIEILETEPYFKNVSLRRLKSHRKLAKTFLEVAREAIRNGRYKAPDLIIASSPPLGLVDASHTIASEAGARVIVDIMDAWPETFERVVPRFLLWPLRRKARRNYLRAAAITTVADNYVELARSYGFSKDIRRFYHGITKGDRPHFPFPSKGTVPLRIVYAGNMGRSYDLVTAVEAVGELGALATLDIAGKGEQEDALKELVQRKGIKGVKFHGYLSESELGELLKTSDVGLIPMDPSSCVGIPYKLADYAKSSLAIVSSLGGESARLLNEYGAGVSYSFGKSASLVQAVKSLLPRLAEMRKASSRMLDEQFDASKIYDSYVDFAIRIF